MKKDDLKNLNLDPSDLLNREEQKNIQGGGGTCTLQCTTGTFPYPVGPDICSNPTEQAHLCYHFGGPGSNPVSCTC